MRFFFFFLANIHCQFGDGGIFEFIKAMDGMMNQMDSQNQAKKTKRLRGFTKKITIHKDGSTTTEVSNIADNSSMDTFFDSVL